MSDDDDDDDDNDNDDEACPCGAEHAEHERGFICEVGLRALRKRARRSSKLCKRLSKRLRESSERLEAVTFHPDEQLQFTNYDVETTASGEKRELISNAVKIANCLMRHCSIHNKLLEVGFTQAFLEQTFDFAFRDSTQALKIEGDGKDRVPHKRFAHAWIMPDERNRTIYVDQTIGQRYELISGADAGAEVVKERHRLELLVAVKLIHELSHLAIRKDDPNAETPTKMGEAGEFVELAVSSGLVGFCFAKAESAERWDGTQMVQSLFISCGPGRTQRVRFPQIVNESFIEFVCSESNKAEPKIKQFHPFQSTGEFARATKSVGLAAAGFDSSGTGGQEESLLHDEDDDPQFEIEGADGVAFIAPVCGTPVAKKMFAKTRE